jgi:hypothetical protein
MATNEARAKRDQSKSDSRREADERRDKVYFEERKAREAANQEKTRRLKAQRLAHEATQAQTPAPAAKKAAKR